jgi:hypothetical protein
MITYRLTIIKRFHNDKFAEEMQEYNAKMIEINEAKRRSGYGILNEQPYPEPPSPYKEEDSLLVILSEEQFNLIRANILKEWK